MTTHATLALTLAFGSVLAAGDPARQDPAPAALDLHCLPLERLDCGCSLKIVSLSCGASHSSGWEAHFFSELQEGAPLWVNVAGRELSLRSELPLDDTFRHGPGDSWLEQYRSESLNVRIEYRPGESTCPAEKGEDGCEYFDVAAEVVVTMPGARSRTYQAAGACGC